MKIRVVLSLVVLLAVVALVGCSQLPTEMVPPAQEPVEGQPVASGVFRLWDKPQKRPADLVYQIQGGRIYEGGNVRPSNIIGSFSGERIFASPSASTDIQYFFEGKRMWEGARVSGKPVYTIEDNGRVYAGVQGDPIIYTFDGARMYEGPRVSPTKIVLQGSGPITGDLRFIVLALAIAEQ